MGTKFVIADCLSGQQIAIEKGLDQSDIIYCKTYSTALAKISLIKKLSKKTNIILDYFGILPEDDLIKLFYTDQTLLSISELGTLAKAILSAKGNSIGVTFEDSSIKMYVKSILGHVSEPSLPLAYIKKTPWVDLDDFLFMRCWRVLKGFPRIPFYTEGKTFVWQQKSFYKRGYKNITKEYPISGFQIYRN